MVDHVSRKARSAIMSAVRGKHTVPEIIVRRAAHRLGLRFRLHDRSLPGRPDLVFARWKTVVFVNGCFWHRHKGCKRTTVPKSNVAFWKRKFLENERRDAANYAQLSALGWRVVIIWQCQAKNIDSASAILARRFQIARKKVGKQHLA